MSESGWQCLKFWGVAGLGGPGVQAIVVLDFCKAIEKVEDCCVSCWSHYGHPVE